MNTDSKNGKIRIIVSMITAVIVIITAFVLLWWYGAFIPGWVGSRSMSTWYGGNYVVLDKRRLTLYEDDSCINVLWKTDKDVFVQDIMIKDIDADGSEEMIMLVWKHGSYGDHMPFWVSKNDTALKQHIFIYRYDENRNDRLRPVWMSSQINYEIDSIASGSNGRIIVNERSGESKQWMWRDFGLKSAGASCPSDISIVCAGDNLVHLTLLDAVDDPFDLYDEIREEIIDADIAALNQETVLVDDPGAVSDYPRFGTPLKAGKAVIDTGFDVVNLANNHVLDKGMYGIDTTVDLFESNNVRCIGACSSTSYSEDAADRIGYIEKEGFRVAFVGFTYGTNGLPQPEGYPYAVSTTDDEKNMVRQLKIARSRADVVIVYVHWGDEYSTTVNEQQRQLARLFEKYGADAVIGTHPHVLQEHELAEDKETGHLTAVYYSLGNLISAQKKEGTDVGGLAYLSFHKDAAGHVLLTGHELKEIRSVR